MSHKNETRGATRNIKIRKNMEINKHIIRKPIMKSKNVISDSGISCLQFLQILTVSSSALHFSHLSGSGVGKNIGKNMDKLLLVAGGYRASII